jgi:DNA helicase-2/ATP-dependent DNA helicase PcrA
VVTRYESNAVTEAAWISAQLASLHAEEGIPWRAMAILVRKNKDLPILHDALKVEGIPVEVANIGGLLAVAEVADVYAWLRLLGHPEDSPALLRILMGSRYRMGMADLRPLTDWASGDSVDEEHGRLPARSLLEAIDHLDPTNESAADLFDQFRREYRELLAAAQGVSLVELCRRILDRTGAWHDVEAMDDAGRLSARLNLHRFLDLTEDWSPLEGRPSLEAFLGYLTSMQDEDAEDLDAARLSGEDAVGLLTVHRAKGLEWDVVVLPALYQDNFPTKPRVYPNPHRFAEVLPYELRLDQKSMPDLAPGVDHEHAKQILGERHLRQEWRLAYVGVTRARRILIATGAHWYGTPEPHKNPRVPSELFDLIDAYPGAEHAGRTLPPPRPELLRVELSSEHAPDPLFEHGWDDALRRTIESAEYPASRAEQLGLVEEFKHELAAMQDMLFALPIPSPSTGASRLETSVTGLVTYAGCPKRFYWSEIDRLPRRPSRAARRGVAIHRRIEMFNRGQPALDEVSPSLYDSPGEWTDGDDPFSVFRSSRFADLQPVLVEAPFELLIGPPLLVRGRIDAIYEPAAGHWEVVDFKSGRPSRDPTRMAQLEAYAVAVADSGLAPNRPDQISVTFAYLGDRLEEQTHLVDGPWEMAARRHLEDLVTGIADGMFEPTPSEACTGCDFLRFCEAGRARVGV